MTKLTFTPGPWTARSDPRGVGGIAIDAVSPNFGPSRIGLVQFAFDLFNDEREANARLMAAAPDLLAALLDALPYVEDVLRNPDQLACFKKGVVQKHAKAIRAAIELATTGERS